MRLKEADALLSEIGFYGDRAVFIYQTREAAETVANHPSRVRAYGGQGALSKTPSGLWKVTFRNPLAVQHPGSREV